MKTIVYILLVLFCMGFASAATISIDEDGGDANTYKGTLDYMDPSVNVEFDYPYSHQHRLTGTITAEGLKPDFTYQVKLMGKPTCLYGASGDDDANEYLGYAGRWTCADCGGTALSRNRNDAQYLANSYYKGDGSECIQGYLVFDYFTTDSGGDMSGKVVLSDSSYHVLWCNGGVCGTSVNSFLVDGLCAPGDVEGQIERGSCGSLILNPGTYEAVIALTEESFHQGDWATVLKKDIEFEITDGVVEPPVCDQELDYINIGDPASEDGHDLQGWSDVNGNWVPGASTYGYGPADQTFRLLMGSGDGCGDAFREAYLSFDVGTNVAYSLEFEHLDGSQPDEFEVYVWYNEAWEPIGTYYQASITEDWVTTSFDLPAGMTGQIDVMLYLISPQVGWCMDWGQTGFSWAKVYGCTQQEDIPEFTTIGAGLALLGAAGFVALRRKK